MIYENQKVKVKWNSYTKKHYVDKGYIYTKMGDEFDCDLKDVMITSTAKIKLKCDYCGEDFYKEYRNYFSEREIINKDCCSNSDCKLTKSEEVNLIKFGVKNHMQTKESQQHLRDMNKTHFEEVVKLCEQKGLILLSSENEYDNDRSRLKIICINHKEEGIQDTNFANIKKNKGCCQFGKFELSAQLTRLNGNYVYNEFINRGLEPQFKPEEYRNNQQNLPYICPDHREMGIQFKQFANLYTNSYKCYYCSKEAMKIKMMLNENDVFKYFKSRDLIVLDTEIYQGKDAHIKFICKHHPNYIQSVSYHSLQKTKVPCEYCRQENSLSKINRKLRSSLSKWKKDSEKYCNYECILTGSKNYEVHHLYSFDAIIKESLSVLNLDVKDKYSAEEIINIKKQVILLHDKYGLGVCIRKDLHTLLHKIYGKEIISDIQFKEFVEKYNNGEFNERLEEAI